MNEAVTQVGGMGGRPRRWHFANAVLDERTLELWVGGRPQRLERKSLELLIVLLRRHGDVVTKDDLLAAVWPGRIVSESVIPKCVTRLREALDDDDQAIIKTVHGYGYRLVPPVNVEGAAAPMLAERAEPRRTAVADNRLESAAAHRPATNSRTGRPLALLALGVLTLLALAAVVRWASRPAPLDKSVAVLPFAALGEAGNADFAHGLHDSVITQLAKVRDLKVISRTSVLRYAAPERNLREIARELGVATVLEGSVQRSGDRLRINAQLIDATSDTHLWAADYDITFGDLFAMQVDLAHRITASVHATLTDAERARIGRAPTRDAGAYDLYVRALETERRTSIDPTDARMAAIAQLEQAVARDPDFALAWAALSRMHDHLYWDGRDPTVRRLQLARDAAETAMRLDPELADARAARALYLYHGYRNYPAALQELEQARRLAPGNALVHEYLGYVHRRQGRWDESIANLRTALELDPHKEWLHGMLAQALAAVGRYDEADRVFARLVAIARDPALATVDRVVHLLPWRVDLDGFEAALGQFPPGYDPGCIVSEFRHTLHILRRRFTQAADAILACREPDVATYGAEKTPTSWFAGEAYRLAGDHEQARRFHARARPVLERSLRHNADQPWNRLRLAFTVAALGRRHEALVHADHAVQMLPVTRDALSGAELLDHAARFHAAFGDVDRALALIEQGLAVPAGVRPRVLALNPYFDPLRGDARFQRFVASVTP